MCVLTLDPENTIFIDGKLEESKSADVVAWMLSSYYEQKADLEATKKIRPKIKRIAKESLELAKKRGEKVSEEKESSTLNRPLITLVLNSPGGNYDELTAIYDMMQLLDADIRTIVMGGAFSAAAIIAISGTCGLRYITPTSRVMFHAVSMGVEGKTQDIKIDYKEAERLNDTIAEVIKKHTKITDEEVHKFIDRDIYILPEDAIKFGMFDGIISGIS